MKLAVWTLMGVPSFNNQAQLIIKAGRKLGFEAELRDIKTQANIKTDKWDRTITLAPFWPRYIFDSVRLNTPWFSKHFTFYGPVDGPHLLNVTFFKVVNQIETLTTSQWCLDQIRSTEVQCRGFIHHGIDPRDFKFTRAEIDSRMRRLRRKYPDRTIFFCNINPIHRKGFTHLAKAIAHLNKTRKDDFVVIMHTGREKALRLEPILAKTVNLEIEDQYGTLPFKQMALKTRCCDVFLLPSMLEGFGLPLLEAMANKRPIICVNMGPLTEMVDHNSAFMVDYTTVKKEKWTQPGCTAQLHDYDFRDLAFTMEDVMDNPKEAKKRGEKAFKTSKKFNYLRVYRPLIQGDY